MGDDSDLLASEAVVALCFNETGESWSDNDLIRNTRIPGGELQSTTGVVYLVDR